MLTLGAKKVSPDCPTLYIALPSVEIAMAIRRTRLLHGSGRMCVVVSINHPNQTKLSYYYRLVGQFNYIVLVDDPRAVCSALHGFN